MIQNKLLPSQANYEKYSAYIDVFPEEIKESNQWYRYLIGR